MTDVLPGTVKPAITTDVLSGIVEPVIATNVLPGIIEPAPDVMTDVLPSTVKPAIMTDVLPGRPTLADVCVTLVCLSGMQSHSQWHIRIH